eukprot:TRINITY_DN16083_c0_g1_i1.p1 TRINITY_DN16083_c0_g1~~TRINITY_DN16083_c0_g1_i1.p1  ORF type:complete len:145 (+),score=26.79 TRINITY_DN16083_c0_g1_i1:35-469(+)
MDKVTGNAERGEKLFKGRCAQCHTTAKDAPNKVGPNLYGLFGRTAGTLPEYKYSDSMKASGIAWRDETLFEFIYNPLKYVPKTKMMFPGFKYEQDRADVIKYLRQATGADPVPPPRNGLSHPATIMVILAVVVLSILAINSKKK